MSPGGRGPHAGVHHKLGIRVHPVPRVSGNSVPETERLLCGEWPGEAPALWDQALGLTQVPAGAHALEAGKRGELSSRDRQSQAQLLFSLEAGTCRPLLSIFQHL